MLGPDGWQLLPALESWEHLRGVGDGHGQRDLLRTSAAVREWAARLMPLAREFLSPAAVPISALWFDKLPTANWQVPWHQDLVAPLAEFLAPGWGPWTVKSGAPYVPLPEPWSSRRIACRLALDTCTENDGPLEVLPGTQSTGILSPEQITEAARQPAVTITMAAGTLLMLHPLLLHRSRPARQPAHRRVLHIEWCDVPLPAGATWLDGSV